MALRMARPYKNRFGVYCLRARTPSDLLARARGGKVALPIGDQKVASVTIGKTVEVSLRTKNVHEARSRHSIADAALRRYWDALRKGPARLSQRTMVGLAGEIYRAFADGLEENPGSPAIWSQVRDMNNRAQEGRLSRLALFGIGMSGDERREMDLEKRFGDFADLMLAKFGYVADAESRSRLIEHVARAADYAAAKLQRNAEGDYRPDDAAHSFPPRPDIDQPSSQSAPRFSELFEKWTEHVSYSDLSDRTKATYQGALRQCWRHLGDPPITAVSRSKLRSYLNARMSSDGKDRLLPRVARDVHKAALSSLFSWAVDEELVVENPASRLPIKVPAGNETRQKEANDNEARELTDAAVAIPNDDAAPQTKHAARKWCPLLMLYTGARVGEVVQLRKADIVENRGGLFIEVTPAAGRVKGKKSRLVPLHPRLLELGFAAFVQRANDGPLFVDPTRKRRTNARSPVTDVVADDLVGWAKRVALRDPALTRPMHSLRHRFVTIARWSGVEEPYIERLVGHSSSHTNRSYGSFPPETLRREIDRLDPDEVEGRKRAGG